MSSLGGYNYQMQPPQESDDDLVERFRNEARLELERERQKNIERQLLMSRPAPPPVVVREKNYYSFKYTWVGCVLYDA